MAEAIGALLQVILLIAGYLIKKAAISDANKKDFFAWVKRAGQDTSSAKLMEYGDAQLKELASKPWEPST